MEKKLFPISEAAKLIGVSVDTLRRWDAEGTLKPSFVSPGKHRFYRKDDIELFMSDVFALAENWATVIEPPAEKLVFHCTLKPEFQTQLMRMEEGLKLIPDCSETYSLIVAVAAEIGNNSFDHNLGNWPDVQGIFFGYDLGKRRIALADRGRGILKTLQAVRPELHDHRDALRVAFTEVVSGRAPENRGNGLKFVRVSAAAGRMRLAFRSGDAEASIDGGQGSLLINATDQPIRGCLALLQF